MKRHSWFLALLIGVSALIFAACGADDNEGKEKDQASDKIEGSVAIDGSGTVFPLMSRIAEEYMTNENSDVSVEVSRAGTSAGFKKFLEKDGTDFNDASRPIKEEELEVAEKNEIEPMELKVALDGLTFVIHKDNDWANEMTPEQLVDIFTNPDVKQWSDLNEEWPKEDIHAMGPNPNHGTYEFFYENVLDETDMKDDVNLQQEYSTLVNLVSEDKNGIAFFGFGYYLSNKDKLQAVHVDFGEGPVEPSLETIREDGPYKDFTRPVFTYVNKEHLQTKPQVYDFARYLVENMNTFASDTGFAPIPEEEANEMLEMIEQAKK